MKKLIIAVVYGVVFLSTQSLNASNFMENALKKSATGSVSSRFRGGYFVGIGYQGSTSGLTDTKIQGFLVEGGVYGLFNPIKNFLDMEVGLSAKYNTGGSQSSGNTGNITYYAGLKQVTIYGGTVFRFGNSQKAVAVGISKALYIDEVQTQDLKDAGFQKDDLENGLGTYIEYQSGNDEIFFVRLEMEKIDVVSTTRTNKAVVSSILFGMKY